MRKRILAIISGAAWLWLAAGCATPARTLSDDGYAQITQAEQDELARRARNVVLADFHEIRSREQGMFVRDTPPEVKISYDGDCRGRAAFSWYAREDRKIYRVVFTGDLTSDSTSDLKVRYSVVRDTAPNIMIDPSGSLRPPPLEISRREWQELKKK